MGKRIKRSKTFPNLLEGLQSRLYIYVYFKKVYKKTSMRYNFFMVTYPSGSSVTVN
jgi:hypothetical protein